MASPSSWEFYKKEQTKILWVHICTQDLTGVAISINKMVEDKISRVQDENSF